MFKEDCTHWSCNSRLNQEGGYTECCGCVPHDNCTTVIMTYGIGTTNTTEEALIDAMTRDFTRIIPRSKSEVRRRLQELLDKRTEEVITYISEQHGWEETEDAHRQHFGLSKKYEKS